MKKNHKKISLTPSEKTLLVNYEKKQANWQSLPKEKTAELIQSAAKTLKKNKRINIRIPEEVVFLIKKKAKEEGLPYQTLIGSVLHKYAYGRLKFQS